MGNNISGGPQLAGATTILEVSGAPGAGTNEVQTLTVTGTPTGGDFKLRFRYDTTAAIPFNAAAAAVQTVLEALPSIGAGNVACAGGPLPGAAVTITFQGALGRLAVETIEVVQQAFTGGVTPAAAVAETTPGVNATHRGARPGTLLVRTDAGQVRLYQNTGTVDAPTWQPVGAQT